MAFNEIIDISEHLWNIFRSAVYPDVDNGRILYGGDFSLLNYAPMDYGIISDSESDRPVMITWGISTCLALCGYDPKRKVGFLSHNSTGINYEISHKPIIHKLRTEYGVSDSDLVFYLTGAVVKNPKKVDDFTLAKVGKAIDYVATNFPNSKIETDIFDWSFKSNFRAKSFGLDTRSGEIYHVHKNNQWEKLRDLKLGEPSFVMG